MISDPGRRRYRSTGPRAARTTGRTRHAPDHAQPLVRHPGLEAAEFYVSVFPHSEITNISYYGEAGPGPAGTVLTVDFVLDGQEYTAINGGPLFTFDEAISLLINCADQDEIDYYWDKLTDGGEESMCGWLKDRFGLSWQVVPADFNDLQNDPDPGRANARDASRARDEEARHRGHPSRRRCGGVARRRWLTCPDARAGRAVVPEPPRFRSGRHRRLPGGRGDGVFWSGAVRRSDRRAGAVGRGRHRARGVGAALAPRLLPAPGPDRAAVAAPRDPRARRPLLLGAAGGGDAGRRRAVQRDGLVPRHRSGW